MRTDREDPLEAFVDESIQLFGRRGYVPTEFISMRKLGTVSAIERLVRSGAIQSGFRRIQKLEMLPRSMEGTVLRFPDRFTPDARACAEFRLNTANDEPLRSR